MKIEIDTNKDSKEDIRRAIGLLKTFLDEKEEKTEAKQQPKKPVDMDEIRKLMEKDKNPERKKKEVQEEDKNEFTITPY